MSRVPLVGGVPDADHPAVVAVVERRESCDAGESVRCSGTLVASRVVLTAAHCLDGRRPEELEVIIATDVDAPGADVLAVIDGVIHPAYDATATTDAHDLALLRLEADSAPASASLASSTTGALAPGTTVRMVAMGAPAFDGVGGVRLAVTTTVASVGATDAWLDGPGAPCGGDSGGAVFVDGSGDELLVAVVKASGARCAPPGLVTLVAPAADDFIAPYIAATATAAPPDRPLLAELDACATSCVTVDDCPLGLLCLPERDGSHCGYRDLRTSAFGDACTEGDGCVAYGQGRARSCRLAVACPDEPPEGCGCRGGDDDGGAMTVTIVLAIVLAYGLRRRGTSPRPRP